MTNATVASADKIKVEGFERLARLVNELPAYVEIVVSGLLRGEQYDIVLLTRDLPADYTDNRWATRRLTSLTYGTECMDFLSYLDGARYTFDDGNFKVAINFEVRGFKS